MSNSLSLSLSLAHSNQVNTFLQVSLTTLWSFIQQATQMSVFDLAPCLSPSANSTSHHGHGHALPHGSSKSSHSVHNDEVAGEIETCNEFR